MNKNRCTIILYDYGGCYSKEGDYLRWSSGGDEIHTLVMQRVTEEVTYSALVDEIGRKIILDGATTKLKLSYFPFVLDPRAPSYISNDVDVFCYLMQVNKDGYRSLLHVELIDDVDQNQGCVQFTGEGLENEVGGGDDMITLYTGEPSEHFEVHHNVLITDHEEMANEDNFGMYEDDDGPFVVEGDDRLGNAWEDGLDITIGQEFGSNEEVKDLVQKASHKFCFEYEIKKSDTMRYVVKCVEAEAGCKWSLRVAKIRDSNLWSVRTYNKMHTCSRTTVSTMRNKRKGTPGVVASILHEFYPGVFETPPPKILMPLVKEKGGVEVSYSTLWRGKKKAAEIVRGSPEESYEMLPSYLYMLEKMNEGTRTFVEWDEERRFKYLFFALGACIEGFQAMRKVIIVDATHLKHAYGGVLIVATAQDGDRHHYPIAFGVADGEKDESWMWFMNKLKLVLPDVDGTVFVSDRNASLIKSIREVFPLSQHGYCIFHLSQNVKGSVCAANKSIVAKRFMDCAHAYTESEFLTLYDAFRKRYPAAAEYLDRSVEPKKWARCYFPGERYNIDTTNCAESINNVFRDARKYSVLRMIDAIVAKLAEWFNKHRRSSAEVPFSQKLVPYVEKVMHDQCVIGKCLTVFELNSLALEYNVIGLDGKSYLVDLTEKTCSCKCFDIDRYPCVHAIAAINRLSNERVVSQHDFCSVFFFMEQWSLAYHRTIYPVPDMSTWMVPDHIRHSGGLPPPHVPKTGRRQTTRIRSAGESRGRVRRRGMYSYFTSDPGVNDSDVNNSGVNDPGGRGRGRGRGRGGM